MNRWQRFEENFSLFTGVIGLFADTITILGAIGASLVLPSFSNLRLVPAALDTLLLLTAGFGLYSLTMIVWFLFRWRRSKQEVKTFGFDELYRERHSLEFPDEFFVLFSLVPLVGLFTGMLMLRSVRNIFWFAVFISLLPTTLWLYLISAQVSVGCIAGSFGSLILSQYATFFALVLDKFFESREL